MRPRLLIGLGLAAIVIALIALAVIEFGPAGPSRKISDQAQSTAQPEGTSAPERKKPAPREARPTPTADPELASNVALVGTLPIEDVTSGDLTLYNNLALVGVYCGEAGVSIIDISQPDSPDLLANTDHYFGTSMEDLEVARIGERDVLVIGLQDCSRRGSPRTHEHPRDAPGGGKTGIDLVDISDPEHPTFLAFFDSGHGVHELDLTRTPDGRTLALLAMPDYEVQTADAQGRGGQGDLAIVDISDPLKPRQIAEWGVLDEPALGQQIYDQAKRGNDFRTQLHSARASADGTRAYLSYWDLGVLILDIDDPARPRYLGRTSYMAGEEGNAHSVAEAQGGKLLIQASEDYTPYDLLISSAVLTDAVPVLDMHISDSLDGLNGELAVVGQACAADELPESLSNQVALIERGGCGLGTKIALAQSRDAQGLIIYNDEPRNTTPKREEREDILSGGEVELPNGRTVTLDIPTVFMQRQAGLALAQARTEEPPMVAIEQRFNGFGYLHFYNISDPGNPVRIGDFASPNTINEDLSEQGWFSVHNPEVEDELQLLYASWYNDGVRVVDLTNPARPREVGFWRGASAPREAPEVNIWSVIPHKGYLFASDLAFGLYVLKYEP